MQEETFGPVILINKVKSSDEAIRLSNASRYGLSASVWSKKNGHRIASQLQFGMVAINEAISYAAIGSVPFGGVKESGHGRVHGAEGLLEFTYARTVVKPRFIFPLVFASFRRTKSTEKFIFRVVKLFRGRSI